MNTARKAALLRSVACALLLLVIVLGTGLAGSFSYAVAPDDPADSAPVDQMLAEEQQDEVEAPVANA